MHNLEDPVNILDPKVAFSHELIGKECVTCLRILPYSFFLKDSSYRDGRVDRCDMCRTAPKMSYAEHTARLKEQNYSSEAVKKQRFANQEDYENHLARQGKWMHSGEFVLRIKKLVPCLFIRDGNFIGDLAVYRIYPGPQSDLEDRNFQYLFFIPTGWMPECSLIEFDDRDIPIREKKRGWRTPLLRLIKAGLLTEADCEEEFGKPTPGADAVWNRELWQYRNRKEIQN
jgi:hypothetical protein